MPVALALAAVVAVAGCGGSAGGSAGAGPASGGAAASRAVTPLPPPPASAVASWGACGPPPIAHRGEPAVAPEESISSFRAAIRDGARVLEGDVHFTKDGRPVLIHDDTVDRTTNGTGRVDQLTLAQVRRLDSGAGTKVPELGELLDLARPHDVRLVLELKQPGATRAQVRAFWSAVERAGMTSRVTVESFHPENLRLMRSVAPDVETALITSTPVSAVQAARVGEAVIPWLQVTTRQRVRQWHARGLKVWAWTMWPADGRAQWRQARSAGVDGMMTNRTADYRAWLRGGCH